MSLVVTSLLVASGVLLGRFLARSGRKDDKDAKDDRGDDGATDEAKAAEPEKGVGKVADKSAEKAKDDARKKAEASVAFADFPCALGDVVMRGTGDEAWLAGALLLADRAPVAALFVAPEAGGDRAVLAHPAPAEELVWLDPLDPAALGLGAEPPASLEDKGDRFDRTKRLPVRVERHGSGAPDVGATAILAEYKSLAGERIVALCGAKPVAWRGMVLEKGMYTLLGAGGTDL